MTPTYDQVTAWNPESMQAIAHAVRALQDGVNEQASKVGDPVHNLTTNEWKGFARTAADERATAETRWLKNVSDKFGDLATTLEDDQPAIRGAMDALKSAKGDAESNGYVLRTGDPGYAVDFDADKTGDPDAEFDPQAANDWHTRLLSLGKAADTAVTDAAKAAAAGLNALNTLTPASIAQNSSTIDPSKAAGDVQAIQDGTATPEQRARFERAMRLTPEQLAKLDRGEPIDISPEQMRYIRQAAGAVDVGSGDLHGIRAFDQFGTKPGDQALRTSLANGLQVLSNPNVHSSSGNGGFAALPQSIKESMTDPNLVTKSRSGKGFFLNRVGDNAAIGRLLGAGSTEYMSGSDIDKKLMEVGRKYTDAQAEYEQSFGPRPEGMGIDPLFDNMRFMKIDGELRLDNGGTASVAGVIQDMLGAVGHDKMAVHDAFTGEHGQDFIHDLLTTQWTDDGTMSGEMLKTDPHDALVDNPNDLNDVYRSRLTGNIMQQVAEYAHTHDGYQTLMDISGSHNDSVGQVNPKMLQILSESMKPYAGELAGDHTPNLLGFDADEVRHSPGQHDFEGASRIFAVMGTDDTAAHTFYGEAMEHIKAEAGEYAHAPNATDAEDHLQVMSHLRGLIDEGLSYSSEDSANSAYEAAQRSWDLKSSIVDKALSLTDDTTDKIPGSDIFVDPLKESLRQSMLGDEPSENDFNADDYRPKEMPPASGGLRDLRTLIATSFQGNVESRLDPGYAAQLPGWFDDNGQLKSLDDIKSIKGEYGEPRWEDEEINTRVRQIISQLSESGYADENHLESYYNDVTSKRGEK